jgi:hypothetical protein
MYWDVPTKSYLTAASELAAARQLGHRVIDVYMLETARSLINLPNASSVNFDCPFKVSMANYKFAVNTITKRPCDTF